MMIFLEKRNLAVWSLIIVLALMVGFLVWETQFRLKNNEANVFIFEQPGGGRITYGENPQLAQIDFFNEVKGEMMEQGVDFIEVNLAEMKIYVRKGGDVLYESPVLTKGRVGSWWETPAGLYKVESKRKSHFSSFGHVYTPWNIQFQGNFFIHGWPYYPDGTPVAGGYSGGCVRIDDEDAKAIYDLAKNGMPVLVFEEGFIGDNFNPNVNMPILIEAKSYLAADLKSGFVYAEKGGAEVRPIASITKLMTALVAAEYINLERDITINQEVLINTSKPRLRVGMTVTPFDLLYPLLLESSNEAAEAIARPIGRNFFIEKMNDKASALGMVTAKFDDPSGISEENLATGEDLFSLARYLYFNRGFILSMSAGREQVTAYGTSVFTNLTNFNDFNLDGFVGGKVGMTSEAGETALMIYEMNINGEERPIMITVLGSSDREGDVKRIFEYIRSKFNMGG